MILIKRILIKKCVYKNIYASNVVCEAEYLRQGLFPVTPACAGVLFAIAPRQYGNKEQLHAPGCNVHGFQSGNERGIIMHPGAKIQLNYFPACFSAYIFKHSSHVLVNIIALF